MPLLPLRGVAVSSSVIRKGLLLEWGSPFPLLLKKLSLQQGEDVLGPQHLLPRQFLQSGGAELHRGTVLSGVLQQSPHLAAASLTSTANFYRAIRLTLPHTIISRVSAAQSKIKSRNDIKKSLCCANIVNECITAAAVADVLRVAQNLRMSAT